MEPKRSKARMLARQPPSMKKKAVVPYTRHGAKPGKVRPVPWKTNLFKLLALSTVLLAQQLVTDGIAKDLEGTVCEKCGLLGLA